MTRPIVCAALAVAALAAQGCQPEEKPYEALPAFSGAKASLPAVPTLPNKQRKLDPSTHTVWGLVHDLHSTVHGDEVRKQKVSVVGYIVKTNLDEAPKCAVHPTGKADPPDCVAPVPSFSIADEKGETKEIIEVLGWASNFANLYSVITKIGTGTGEGVKESDPMYGVEIPAPIPAVGAKVKVTGTYGITFTKSTSGVAANPKYGIVTFEKLEYLEPPTERVVLPGMPGYKKK